MKETEKELDTLIQCKESELATTSKTAIPTVAIVVPLALAASLAQTAPPAIALLFTTEYTTASASTEKTTELAKAMKEMSIQAT